MKKSTFCILCLLLLATQPLAIGAEDDKANNGGSFLHEQANGLDPTLRPFGLLIADNVVFFFNLIVGAAILVSGAIGVYQKKKGKYGQAADSKYLSWEIAKVGLLTIFLFDLFILITNNHTFGL